MQHAQLVIDMFLQIRIGRVTRGVHSIMIDLIVIVTMFH